MKHLLLFLFSLFFTCAVFASHIVGGEMIYEFVSDNPTASTKKYRITLRLFRDENCPPPCADMPPDVFIGIFNNDTRVQYPGPASYFTVTRNSELKVPENPAPPCITNKPNLLYNVATYTFTVDLPYNQNGYTAAYQTCCRVASMKNVFNPLGGQGGGNGTGSTYACVIPGLSQLAATTGFNNSPSFFQGISIICQNRKFTLDFSAEDADDDSLVYSFSPAFNGGSTTAAENVNPAPPNFTAELYYGSVPYINGYSADEPLGAGVVINPQTGLISGIAPPIGKYVVCVNIDEYRQGKLIGRHRKDFMVNVTDCDFAGAQLQPTYVSCDGLNYTFTNLNPSSLNKTYLWDFGDGTTSTEEMPTHTFPTAGDYKIKLTVNANQPCSEEADAVIKVYPGFFPDFDFNGICMYKPTAFTDRTTTVHGVVDSWKWDFGKSGTTTDVSTQQHPTYSYIQAGNYTARLIVTNSKGCIDTITKPIGIIDKPALKMAFKDTLICSGDVLQLEAIGNGIFNWTPTGAITNAGTATPSVQPPSTTKYFVELDDNGCVSTDSVRVRVVDFVTLRAWADTTICSTDQAFLGAETDALRFEWTPAATISNPSVLHAVARPVTTTTYRVTGYIGGCAPASDEMVVRTVPYPVAHAGADTVICYETGAQLHGSMVGNSFTWTPAGRLVSTGTLSPQTQVLTTTTDYILTVRDVLGCPKPVSDTVTVVVLPQIHASAGRDTAVVVTQPLQLQASGGTGYLWTPATALNDTNIPNPKAVYNGSFESIRYKVFVSNAAGCLDSAFVTVRIFKTTPRVFVPTGFTPNGDGRNDVFRPTAAGIAKLEYFSVYNRWGERVFHTTIDGRGWDGRLNGREQGTGTFAWMVKGVDYLGKVFFAKGTVTLIR